MNELLQASAGVIAKWLAAKLPGLSANWWREHVVDRLTFQQQRFAEDRRIQSLSGLDLAAVLRVLDQNWNELAAVNPLPREARNWVKELQSARNRWAHAPAGGVGPTDAFRDADTLERLLAVVGASPDLMERLSAFKAETLGRLAPKLEPQGAPAVGASEAAAPRPATASAPAPASASKFAVGQLLCLRSNPAAVFPVLEVLAGGAVETRYRVFENGARQVYYESQLQALEEPEADRKTLTAAELSSLLSAAQLSSPSASALYSLNSGRVRFVPYQYRPVFKLIRADRPRLLVADEVGVGKTIEAGLILKELQARSDIKSVLIICPKALVTERKWELEMKRFDEHFVHLDGSLLRHCIKETHLGGEWPAQYERAILPTSLFDNDLLFGRSGRGKARDPGLLELDPPPKFDLVIVDEAHHIRNSETFLHQAVRYFADNAEAVVFLSATPVQLGRDDLYTLLNVLRPDVIIDPASFEQMAEPNQFINAAIQACRRGETGWSELVREQLREVAATTWGREVLAINPGFQHIYDGLAEGAEDGASRIKTIYSLEGLFTFSSLINRTRRRDIGEFTTRKAETVSTEFTPSQKELHDDLLSVIARILARLHGNLNVKFMMSTVSRQAASSLYGLAPALRDILRGKLASLEEADDPDDGVEREFDFVEQIRGDIESLLRRASSLDPNDPKAAAFMKVVADKLAMPRNKVLVFSTFRHTLRYLVGKLTAANVRFGLVHGGIPDEERSALRRRFALPKESEEALDVLLSSEVGCEGLDFQFCDCLVNFDLPWNPMRVEQRIGRIDRYGQASEAVGIFNFITPGTIDAEIFDRCLSRIGVFQHAIGGNEEILGEITKELHNIAESFTLSDEERQQRLLQLSDNKIRQIEEEQRLEERQGELFGLNLAAASWEQRLARSRSHWLEPRALGLAVGSYLARRLGKEQDYLLGEKALKTLRLGQEARATLLEDFRKLPRSTDPMHRAWERWLKGTSPTLSVTFEQEAAVENASAALLSLGHPLLRQAAAFLQEADAIAVRLSVVNEVLPEGVHPFALYRWARQGAKRDEDLIPVTESPAVADALLEVLPSAVDASGLELPGQQVWDDLDKVHHQLWLRESTQHAEDNRQLVGVRIQSLTASFTARRALLEEQIGRATNDKIRVMKQAELERAQVDFDVRVAALRKAAESGDIKATPAVFGVLEVRRAQ
ncbi:MAG: helicase-related protein [Pseudomonadota bacterium]